MTNVDTKKLLQLINLDKLFFYVCHVRSKQQEKCKKKEDKLGLSSAKLRAQLASPAGSIHLCPSFDL